MVLAGPNRCHSWGTGSAADVTGDVGKPFMKRRHQGWMREDYMATFTVLRGIANILC
jgi:hypothetical protein